MRAASDSMTTQASTSPPAEHVDDVPLPPNPAVGRARAVDRWLQVGAVLAVAVPVLLLLARPVLHDGPFSHVSDVAVTELAVDRAAELDQALGPYSRFQWHHPGPLLFYLMAIPYRLMGGRGEGLVVATVIVNAAASVWLVAVIARRGGGHAAMGAAAALTALHLALSSAFLADPWTPILLAVPAALLVVLCADVAVGGRWSPVGAAAVGTYLVQTHVGMTAVVVAALTVALVARVALTALAPPAPRSPRREVASLTAALATGLVLWAPPLWQEVRDDPGNLSALARFFAAASGGHSAREAAGALGSGMLVVPARRHLSDDGVVLADTAALVVVLAGIVVVTVVAARRRQWFAVGLGAVSLVGALAALTSLLRVQGPIYGYLVLWAGAITLGGVLAGVVLVADRMRSGPGRSDRPPLWLRRIGSVAVVVVTLAVAASSSRQALSFDPGEGAADVRAATTAVSSLLGPSAADVLVCIPSLPAWPVTAGVVADLRRDGVDVRLQPSWLFMFGDHLAPTGSETVMVELDLVGHPVRAVPLGPPTATATTSEVRAHLHRIPPGTAPEDACLPTL